MNFEKIDFTESKVFKIAKLIKDFMKSRGIFLRMDRKQRILVYFPKDMPKIRIEELKVILKSEFPEEKFLFLEYQKSIF